MVSPVSSGRGHPETGGVGQVVLTLALRESTGDRTPRASERT